ncbi:hypothetical protein PG991_006669 [Apiospora marii]|uniref:Zn(2)-C6 fungal-type domain-containing protein n=1 Tax=Apiospora marii TaxID=335849 RepID=A0ABR1RZT4_9PEZI
MTLSPRIRMATPNMACRWAKRLGCADSGTAADLMPGPRSRQGCTECRRRRRKCDEQRPICGQCSTFDRSCTYALKVVWSDGLRSNRPAPGPRSQPSELIAEASVHEDLCRGLIPATLHSPQLLSACLALSAAGILSRGLSEVDGIAISRILGHLQTSGLALLRTALEAGQMNETILATCLIWCLTDVFTYRQGSTSSWRIHLQGIKAILDSTQAHRYFSTDSGAAKSAMRHLYLLYLSLQTLPHVPAIAVSELSNNCENTALETSNEREEEEEAIVMGPKIDGFLGYSEELLHIIQKVNQLARSHTAGAGGTQYEADILLGKLNAMINRDSQIPPDVAIYSSLSPESNREFELCHRTFQQATLIHVYRRLYHLPSNSPPIQDAVLAITKMVTEMAQGQPCHTWVAMAMPLFTIGCEAFTDDQQSFVLDKIHKLDLCIGSYHVRIIGQALEDLWRIRREAGDFDGHLCAAELLEGLHYNIILF